MLEEPKSKIDRDDSSSQICLEELFDYHRIHQWNYLKILLYFPLGTILLLVRLSVCFVGFFVLPLLHPSSPIRSIILKGMCKVLGYIIEVDVKNIDENIRILVANHVSILDRLAVNVVVPCNVIPNSFQKDYVDSLSFWRDIDFKYYTSLSSTDSNSLKLYINDSSLHILHFPEGAVTNGKVGLLKFHPGIFSLDMPIQPVLVSISFHSLMISPSIIGGYVLVDFLWSLYHPCTVFTVKTLPSMVKSHEESVIDFTNRVEITMAKAMKISPTTFTSSDKIDLLKKLHSSKATLRYSSSKDHTPQVDIDKLALNMLHHSKDIQKTLNMAASTFGKTPKDRMLSYQERRSMLMEIARRRYKEKHDL